MWKQKDHMYVFMIEKQPFVDTKGSYVCFHDKKTTMWKQKEQMYVFMIKKTTMWSYSRYAFMIKKNNECVKR